MQDCEKAYRAVARETEKAIDIPAVQRRREEIYINSPPPEIIVLSPSKIDGDQPL